MYQFQEGLFIPREVLEDIDLNPGEKLVLLAHYHNPKATQVELGRMTGLHARTVRRILSSLKAKNGTVGPPKPVIDPDLGGLSGDSRQDNTPQRAHYLPDTFSPSDSNWAWARETHPKVDSITETEKFLDYWHSLGAISRARKADWQLTWKNWIRNAHQYQATRTPRSSSTLYDAIEAIHPR